MDDGEGTEVSDDEWGHIEWLEGIIHPRINEVESEMREAFYLLEDILENLIERIKKLERKDD